MSSIEQQEKFYARFANESYAKSSDRVKEQDGYVYDSKLSDRRHAVYHNADENKTILGIRGTKTDLSKDSVDDIKTDSSILIGNLTATKRYKQATDKFEGVREKYGDSKVSISAHSLGARISEEMAARQDGISEVHSYNPGSFVKDALVDVDCKYNKSKQCRMRKQRINRYTVEGDSLSILSHSGKGVKTHRHKRSRKGVNPHALVNFL